MKVFPWLCTIASLTLLVGVSPALGAVPTEAEMAEHLSRAAAETPSPEDDTADWGALLERLRERSPDKYEALQEVIEHREERPALYRKMMERATSLATRRQSRADHRLDREEVRAQKAELRELAERYHGAQRAEKRALEQELHERVEQLFDEHQAHMEARVQEMEARLAAMELRAAEARVKLAEREAEREERITAHLKRLLEEE